MGLVMRGCDKNAGRFANDLAMGTVMRICDENAGRFANDWRVLAGTGGYCWVLVGHFLRDVFGAHF